MADKTVDHGHIAVMDNGTVRQFGTPSEVYEEPVDLFVAGFMGSPSMNIIRGRVVADGRSAIEVTDSEGSVRFPVPEGLMPKIRDLLGRKVHLGLRPEAITPVGGHSSGPDVFQFERMVDVVEPTGPDTMLVFTLGGIEVTARVQPDAPAERDKLFRFEVNLAKAKLFDAESGMRI